MKDFGKFLFQKPTFIEFPYSWVQHIPFSFFLIEKLNPEIFVELGTHCGNSYFSFCQAVNELNRRTKTFAVDLWTGDEHAGYYANDVFERVKDINNKHFSQFSGLLRMSFDEANSYFNDNSIDLLHIDGLHFYDAVKHDFETWLPKMSNKGVVVFHDTNVREREFGVWKLFEELRSRFPSCEFTHGHGLGVLCVGSDVDDFFLRFVKNFNEQSFITNLFASLGERIDLLKNNVIFNQGLLHQKQELDTNFILINQKNEELNQKNEELKQKKEELNQKNEELKQKDEELNQKNEELNQKHEELKQKNEELNQVFASRSWNIIKLLRNRMPFLVSVIKNYLYFWTAAKEKIKHKGGSIKKDFALHRDNITGYRINDFEPLGSDTDLMDVIIGPTVRILESIQSQHNTIVNFNGKNAVVLAHWDPDDVVDPYVIHYLAHFKELSWITVLISHKAIKLTDDLIQVADAVLYRTCPGYDFTSWKGALEYFPSLIEAKELILTNDSVFAPVGSISPMHSVMADISCDFWGPVGSRQHTPHLQSYYLVFRSKALRHEAFARFWAVVQPDTDREQAIRYETTLSSWLSRHGLQPAIYAPMPKMNDNISNLSLDSWRELINMGTPFFKRELLKQNVRHANIDDCMAVLADAGYPIHLIANYFKRIGVTTTVPMPPRAVAPEGVWPPDVRVLEIPCNLDNCTQLLPEEKEKIGTVGVFLHIYYEDLTEELLQCALYVPEPRRVYISTDTKTKEIYIKKIFDLHCVEAEIRVLPNIGWDIAPFLVGFADRIREHTIILRLHSKKSLQISGDIGKHWRKMLLNTLAGSQSNTQGIMRAFALNQELGMLCPPHADHWKDCVHFGGNYLRIEQLLSRLGITIRPDLPIDFPMGSMFWCRSSVLEPLLEMQLCFEDFKPTISELRDQTLAHSIERLFFFGCGITRHHWARLPITNKL